MTLNTALVFALAFGFYTHADYSDNQPLAWSANHHGEQIPITNHRGVELPSLTATLTAGGENGPVLIQDSNLLDHLGHFDRERIPERVVHAKGGGAFGMFEVTHDISQFTKAQVFSKVGLKTPVLARFSTTIAQSGGADSERDGRGFAVKFYTDAGNWDLVGNNLPVFPIRDPILFPSLIRSRKRNPSTHLHNPNSFWDFNSLRPETTFHTMMMFSDLGTPDGFRHQNGFGVHTFKFVNASGSAVFVKFHWVSNQGVKNLTSAEAARLKGEDPDYAIRDLYNAIEAGNYPRWNLFVQIMELSEVEKYKWNPFDITKLWLVKDFPLIPVGCMVLNKNPTDYFTQIEQAAFSPSHMIPGIEASPDRMLQGRLFSYPDTQRYRLGVNFLQLPINRPNPTVAVNPYQKDGFMCSTDNGRGVPNYYPNSFGGPTILPNNNNISESEFLVFANAKREDVGGIDNYSQPDIWWKTELDQGQRERLVENLADGIQSISSYEVQSRVLSKMFDPVNSEISSMLRSSLRREIINRNKK